MSFDSQYAFNHFYEILQAAPVAVLVTVVSAFLGLFGGMLFCVVRLRRIPVLNTIVGLLVSLIRSTPILVQLYVVCYGMPRIVAFVHQNPKFVSNVTIYPNTVAISRSRSMPVRIFARFSEALTSRLVRARGSQSNH